ncbi:MAG: response regulator transcription factor [Planctomycetales bacterium]|nr:response regulator transcription factor [Planctomycetales bacterium]
MARIVVVEDEEHLAHGIRYNLEAEGHEVATFSEGPSALQHIEEHPNQVDLVILDLMLPGMSGYAVCETLRAADHEMPILMLTARTLTEDRVRGFEVGADQYMNKPFDLEEFLTRINNLLARSQRRVEKGGRVSKSAEMFSFAGADINFETFEVQVRGQKVRMTQKEMRLLRYFVENEGRVVSRDELLENVWEMPGTITTRAPDQFIRRLRKIFEPDPAAPIHFLTIRDAGYRFVADGVPVG